MTTRIFFTLDSLGAVHYLYQYSLQQFMDQVYFVLNQNEQLKAIPKSEPGLRLKMITKQLFTSINQTVG